MYCQSFAKITLILKHHSAPINSCHNYKLLSDSQISNSNEKYNVEFIRIKRTLWAEPSLSMKSMKQINERSDVSDDSEEQYIKTSLVLKYPSKYHIFNIFGGLYYTEKLEFDAKMEIKFMTVFYLSELFKFILKNDISIYRISPNLNSIILQEIILHDKFVELTNLTTLSETIKKLESQHNSEENIEHSEESQTESEHNENLANPDNLANITKFVVNQKLSDSIQLYINLFNHSSLHIRPPLIENLNPPEQPIESDENINLDEETYNIKNDIDKINEPNRKYIDENNGSTERKPSRIEEIYNYIKQQNSTENMNDLNGPNNSKLSPEFILSNHVQLSNEGFKMTTTAEDEQQNTDESQNSDSDESTEISTESTESSDSSLTEQQNSNSNSVEQQNSNEPQTLNSNEQQNSASTELNTQST